jgi:hypothetical protein
MKNYKLLINPFAEFELIQAKKNYNLHKEDLGEIFVKEIEKTITRINKNPLQFPIVNKNIRKAIVSNFPYTIFFYVVNDIINVFAVFHSSRNPMIWKERF